METENASEIVYKWAYMAHKVYDGYPFWNSFCYVYHKESDTALVVIKDVDDSYHMVHICPDSLSNVSFISI